MKLSLYTLSMCFAILPVMLLVGSVIYRLCYDTNSKDDNCQSSETVEFKGHHRIISYKGTGRFEAYFFPDRQFSGYRYFSSNNRVSIDVANNGLVGCNLASFHFIVVRCNIKVEGL